MLRLTEHGDDEVAPLLEGLAAHGDEVLRAVQRLDRGPLRDRAGARGLLALHHVHRLDQRRRAGGVADAPAGHRIGLGDAVHRQRARIEARLDLRGRGEDEVAVDEMLVHVVGEHPDMGMAHQHLGERLQFVAGVGGARRVRGRVQHHPLGARRDRALQVLRPQLEGVFQRGRHEDRLAAVDQHHVGIADPIGRGDDHLVALVQRRQEGVVENLLAARADDGVGRLVVEPVLALELGGDRLAQRRDAEHRGVLGLAAPNRLDRRLLDVVGRVEVRLADRQRNHVAPLGFEIARLLRHRDGRGRLNARKDVGDEGHDRGSSCSGAVAKGGAP